MKINKILTYVFCGAAMLTFAACADNTVADFKVDPPSDYDVDNPLNKYDAIKTYVDRAAHPGFKISAAISADDFNKRELVHAAAVSNFDEVALGNAMKYGSIVQNDGSYNFATLNTFLPYAEEAGLTVYGHTLAWHAQQNTTYLNDVVLADVKIPVELITDHYTDFSTATDFNGKVTSGEKPKIVDGALVSVNACKFNLAEGINMEKGLEYEVTFMASASKNASITLTIAGVKQDQKAAITTEPTVFTYKIKPANDVQNAEVYIDQGRFSGTMTYYNVKVTHYPLDTRPQTAEEKKESLTKEMNRWCKEMMATCAGRVKAWDMINEAISGEGNIEGKYYDLQHASASGSDFFWQNYFGNENYGPIVEKAAREAYAAAGGDPAELKLFVNDYNLETWYDDNKKLASLIYWVGVWEKNGAKIDGLGSQMHISYEANEAKQKQRADHVVKMLHMMANTGKLVRISELDMGYNDAEGKSVSAANLTDAQRQQMADYYRFIIQMYFKIVPQAQQYGICQWCLTDAPSNSGWRGGEPVGLWTLDWQRTASYAAYCEALSTPIPNTEDFFEYLKQIKK